MDSRQLLEKHFVCDGHADTVARVAFSGGNFISGEHVSHFHIDYERLRQGCVNLQFMAVFIPQEIPRHQGTVTALWILQVAHRISEALSGELGLVTTKESLERLGHDGRSHFLMTLEGASPLISDLDVLEIFFRFGVRSVGLTHNHNNAVAGGCKPPDGNRYGLTDFGREVVRRMEELGVLVDVAHLSRQGFYDLLEVAQRPFVNTHCCCGHLVDIERNMTDDQLRQLAQVGGVAGITYVPDFLAGEGHSEEVTSHHVFRHLEHAVEVMGIDHVALGSDFDGVRNLPTDLGSPPQVVHLVDRCLEAGWDETSIAKVLGGNWFRVLREILPGTQAGLATLK